MAADTVPNVRDRYSSHLHTVVRQLKPFDGIDVTGKNVTVNFDYATTYYVSLKYFDNANVGAIKTNVNNGVLLIDSQNFDWQRVCSRWCIPDTYNMVVTVYSPNSPSINFGDGSTGTSRFMKAPFPGP